MNQIKTKTAIYFNLNILLEIKILNISNLYYLIIFILFKWGLGIGDWGLVIGGWG